MTELREDIAVRFGNAYVHKVVATKHGPVLLQDENKAVCLSWTGTDPKNSSITALIKINQAKNWNEYNAALALYSGAPRTFLFGDRQGNVGYHVAGIIPIRSAGAGNIVATGWDGEGDWHGHLKFEDLPHGYNPTQGYAVADDPSFVNTPSINNPLRALHIAGALDTYKRSAQKVGLPEMAILEGDQTAAFAPLVKKELEKAITQTQLIDEFQTSALTSISRWDGVLKGDSVAATVYESFLLTLTRRALEPKLGAKMTQEYMMRWPRWSLFTQKILTTKPKEWLPPEERSYETFLITTFAQALKNVRLATNATEIDKCPWQAVHQIKFKPVIEDNLTSGTAFLATIFQLSAVGVGGDQDCVNACNVAAAEKPWDFSCNSGPVQRFLCDMGDGEKFYD
ncbi:MAG: penicillin acylase family protein, partial [Terriglobales bacterium]